MTFLSLICEVTESNLTAAASTFHFIDCRWLHKAIIKGPRLPHSGAGPQNWNEPDCLEDAAREVVLKPNLGSFSVIRLFSAADTDA